MKTSSSRIFIASLIFINLAAPIALAQDGIVRLPGVPQKQAAQKQTAPESGILIHEADHQVAAAEAEDLQAVVPPEVLVIKRDPNAISIPAGESGYIERPTASSSVKINSDFGYRRDPFTRRSKFHSGIDLKARWGTPIGASHTGTVRFAGWHRGYGNLIIVDHGGGVSTYYAHLSKFELAVGDKVSRGTIVGYAGSTGRATSSHLHYEVRYEDQPVNPLRPLALDPSSPFFNQQKSSDTVTSPAPKEPDPK